MNASDIEELRKAASIEGTELGEYWAALCGAWDRRDLCSRNFQLALETELAAELQSLRKDFVFEETTETVKSVIMISPYRTEE